MDFTLDTEQKALRDAVREMASRVDRAASEVGPAPFDADLWSDLAQMGLLGLTIATERGGLGATAVEAAIAATELGRGQLDAPYALALLAARLVEDLDGDAHAELLGAIATGQAVVLPALTEPLRPFGPTAHDVTATPGGPGPEPAERWSLTGVKEPVPAAGWSSHLVVTAAAGDHTGVFLVAAEAVAESDRVVLDGTRATLLGSLEAAGPALRRAIGLGHALLGAEALGAMDLALTMTRDYLTTRRQFGVPLATFQALTHRAADMYVSVELARSAVQYAAMTAAQAPDDTDAILRARAVVGAAARHIGQEAIQLHGGIGMTAEYSVGRLTSRLTAIEHTLGDTRTVLADLAGRVADHDEVDVLV